MKHDAEACLDAGIAMVNCVPVFIASDVAAAEGGWSDRFRSAGLPIMGEESKSQLGETIVYRTIGCLLSGRSVKLERTYQLNTDGNTDFLNMLERDRLRSKENSKTESVRVRWAIGSKPERFTSAPRIMKITIKSHSFAW